MAEKQDDAGAAHGDTAGVITHPPLIYLAGLLLGWGADALFRLPPLPGLAGDARIPLAAVLGIGGLLLVLAAAGLFVRAGTSIPPHRPSTALVTGGLYRFSRNPIYVGATLCYLAVTAFFASLGALILLPAVLLVMEFGVIRREERYLARKFGRPYLDYRTRVRRWL